MVRKYTSSSLPRLFDENNIITQSQPNEELVKAIKEYEQQQAEDDKIDNQEQQDIDEEGDNIQKLLIETGIKTEVKPVCMFKDRMQLKKENTQKKRMVKQLQKINKKLKYQYEMVLFNNKKIQKFLKQIQDALKNDNNNDQKINKILYQTVKIINNQQQQQKYHTDKLAKKIKIYEIKQLKYYLNILKNQKNKLGLLLSEQNKINQMLRNQQNFNEEQIICFQSGQNFIKDALQSQLLRTFSNKQLYQRQKSQIKISLCYKQAQCIKRQIAKIDKLIREQLLKKQGLQYQIQLQNTKIKSKKKTRESDQFYIREQIKNKKTKINTLVQEYQQKKKTYQYITKFTKQLKNQLEELKKNHQVVKDQYEQQINKLSKQIQQWNRKYKAQLIEQQFINKKGITKQAIIGKDNTCPQRKIRVVKIQQIDNLRKKLRFYLIEGNFDLVQFIKKRILGLNQSIKLQQLYQRLCGLQPFEQEDNAEIFKFARYIVQDNNSDYSRINPEESIEVGMAALILKNLLRSQLTSQNISKVTEGLKQFLNTNFDAIRTDIWLNSGKHQNFTQVNLRYSLSKYIKEQVDIDRYIELIQYMIWNKFGEGRSYKIGNFEKISQILLGRKLVKDQKNRISKNTIKSIFQQIYQNLPDNLQDASIQNYK